MAFNFNKLSTVQKLLIVLIALLIVWMVYMCKRKTPNAPASSFTTSRFTATGEGTSPPINIDSIKDDTVLIIYAPWCGHCKSSMGEFVKASKQSDNIMLVNSEDPSNMDLLSKYKVQGFPTIMKASGEKYSGPRKAEAIVDFASK